MRHIQGIRIIACHFRWPQPKEQREKTQSVQSSVYSEYSESTKANHQQTENIAFESTTAVWRSVSATKQWLPPPPISNQLPKLHCDKSKTETEGIYLHSSTTVHVSSAALENLPGTKEIKLSTTLGWTNVCSQMNQQQTIIDNYS